jgi:tetratricopeptide (TPR) repeat protein
MGKNKKNKNLNRVNLDDNDEQLENNANDEFEEVISKKKNLFEQLELDESEYCDECGRECDGAHAVHIKINNIQNTSNNRHPPLDSTLMYESSTTKDNDEYFSKGYHYDEYYNDYEKAIEYYKLSLIHDSSNYHGVAAHNMALLYQNKLGDMTNAELYYKQACNNNYNSFSNLALLYYTQNKYAEALPYFEQSVKRKNTRIFYEYAHTHQKLGNVKDAFKFLQYHLMLKNATINERKMFGIILSSLTI